MLSAASLPWVSSRWFTTNEARLHAQRCRQHGIQMVAKSNTKASIQAKNTRELVDRIKEQLLGAHEQPPSSYDTAWVAMVPAPGAAQAPRFPRFVEWILQNQHDDGSWGLARLDPCSHGKDALNSTLACILALKRWNVGDLHIRKGLRFIASTASFIADEKCNTPIGFNIIFPGMIKYGMDMGMEFPLRQSDLDVIFRLQQLEVKSSKTSGRKAYMAYVAEGLGDIDDWNTILTHQSKNGSLFNSPSATSALAIRIGDMNALKYLDDIIGNKFCNSVPTAYPSSIYSKLCMVDTLQKMGISNHFSSEINSILHMIYSSWLQNDEEIIADVETCAMAFRILRVRGYHVSSDVLSPFAEDSRFHDSLQGNLNDSKTLLELYKASHVRIFEDEWILESIGSWASKLLMQQLGSRSVSQSVMLHEVEYALKMPLYTSTVQLIEQKRNIEQFSTKTTNMRKSVYMASHGAEDILALATKDFKSAQSLYHQEIECLERWFQEVRLGHLEFARLMPLTLWIFLASGIFPSESSDARVAWIKNVILIIAVDDFFDGGGSTEELENFVELIETWDTHPEISFCSKSVEILFYACYNTNNHIGAMAREVQNRSIMGHITELWINYVRAAMAEAEWTRKRYVPTMEEYMPVAEMSFAYGPILIPSLYLVGPELSEDIVKSPEFKDIARLTSTYARLLNDLNTYKKESVEGYVNSVLLHAHHHCGSTSSSSIEEAKMEIKNIICISYKELLRLVLRDSGTVPRYIRELWWDMCKVTSEFYLDGDGFCSIQLVAATNAVIFEPLKLEAETSC